MIIAATALAALAAGLGTVAALSWLTRTPPAQPVVMAHGAGGAAVLLAVLLIDARTEPAYPWLLAAVALTIALGLTLFLFRSRQERYPHPVFGLHVLAALATLGILGAALL